MIGSIQILGHYAINIFSLFAFLAKMGNGWDKVAFKDAVLLQISKIFIKQWKYLYKTFKFKIFTEVFWVKIIERTHKYYCFIYY